MISFSSGRREISRELTVSLLVLFLHPLTPISLEIPGEFFCFLVKLVMPGILSSAVAFLSKIRFIWEELAMLSSYPVNLPSLDA